MDSSYTLQIIVLIFLLLLSAFFSASETALMSLSKIRIRHMVEDGVKGAKLIEKLTEDPNKLLGSILVGNNVVNIGASALATSVAVKAFGESGVGIATAIMTILVLIFGEITPKSIAKQRSEGVSLKVSGIVNIIVKILRPFVAIFTFISSTVLKLFGGDLNKDQPFITQEELKTMVDVGEEEGVLEEEEKEMIFNVFEFGDIQVKDVMVQRVDIVALGLDSTYDDVIDIIKEEQFSRIPVYNESIDDIIGIMYVKDLILLNNKDNFKVKDCIREAYYTFEFKKVTELFKEMKKSRNHMAVVLDEYGGTVGIVTIEDLLEEIVGEIEDEYDELEEEIEVVKEDEYIVDGRIRLDDLSDLIGVKMESEEFDSIGGFVIGQLGRIPEPKEEVSYENMRFVVEEIDKNRIKKVRIFT
ncbi:HlyC/CorC family transporter [Clostridium intestinale]|uniref:Putative membrane CBS domain-containing protein n=1 Tax=Clostridium intestinale URNW TaxID=1294142 RepID=U2PY15_9CLOT|nr:hemolysin family protein [Clostridium intestinale]ERK28684.1 putative membrane CBS domain-containing protein [Clostridium intestinale URNW]